MKLYELATLIIGAIVIFGLLFAPNPDIDGDGYRDQLRIKEDAIYFEGVAPVEKIVEESAE